MRKASRRGSSPGFMVYAKLLKEQIHVAVVQESLQTRSSSKKIKSIRKEAIKLGFTKAYQEKRFEDILSVAKKLANDILENNSEINDFVEIARMKAGEL